MPAVTRIGDDEVPHCSGMVRDEGSGNVFCNSIGISRQGDNSTSHLTPPASPSCPSHVAPITTGSSIVFVNSVGCGRVGDATCTQVAEGSENVFAG